MHTYTDTHPVGPPELMIRPSGFGGLGVACWALVPKFARSNPAEKILNMPSFGGEVKPSDPCLRFTACERSFQMAWISPFLGKITGHFSLIVPPFLARGLSRRCRRGDAWRCKRASTISLYGCVTANSSIEEE
jgi:hypothetical protein